MLRMEMFVNSGPANKWCRQDSRAKLCRQSIILCSQKQYHSHLNSLSKKRWQGIEEGRGWVQRKKMKMFSWWGNISRTGKKFTFYSAWECNQDDSEGDTQKQISVIWYRTSSSCFCLTSHRLLLIKQWILLLGSSQVLRKFPKLKRILDFIWPLS